jgi:hypothetical protein
MRSATVEVLSGAAFLLTFCAKQDRQKKEPIDGTRAAQAEEPESKILTISCEENSAGTPPVALEITENVCPGTKNSN